jgi:galactofuranosylgalactofuranosylrhamnosyl-N-acetylglucosaminyl-diphospho-decaprenol beta-1,5/1,6-galactofuranosyltransferase
VFAWEGRYWQMTSTVSRPAGPAAEAPWDELDPPAPSAETLLARVIMPDPADADEIRALCFHVPPGSKRPRALRGGELAVPADSGVSFCSYFGAFPAGYWARWTTLSSVCLYLHVSGACRVDVYRSRADGSRVQVRSEPVTEATTLTFELDLAPFADGGWLWFDVTCEHEAVRIRDAAWYALQPPSGEAGIAAVITTHDRPDDCAAALAALGSDPLVVAALDSVLVVDQGERPVTGAPGYPEAAAVLGERLRVVSQANLGSSGGFARGMHEALSHTEAEQVLLFDDDIVIDPDCVLRALAFSRFATRPLLVGGQMLSAESRSVLHSMG